jgi:uncharacterized protein
VLKVVLDTQVIIAGIVFGGSARDVLTCINKGKIEHYITKEILDEVVQILEFKFEYPKNKLVAIWNELSETALLTEPDIKLDVIRNDPIGNNVIECAVFSSCDYIVSGDKDLLQLSEYHSIEIISAKNFVELI